jgi:hypothetical protein
MGMADRASGEPMTPEVHHRIGSVTKTFTATLVLKGAEKGLLSLDDPIDKYASVRLDSFVSDAPPLNEPPLKGDLAYGIGLGKDHGWIGHNGEILGYNTYLFYHPDLDAVVVVEVNSDVSSGKCPKDVPIMSEWPRSVPCELPADRIFEALAQGLGKPSPSPPE